ncbi:MAG: glycosyltransferase family 39 protein [Candidatus Krumholzibacteriota bacterium]|nr:glycosyltransferase family 39 protein [Candidatus Krumholzibacteriota bacterium]
MSPRSERFGLAAVLLIYLALQAALWGYVTDDTYIHLVYANHLLLGKGWVFNLGEPSYGSTSPLWVLLLAPFASGEAAGILAARLAAILAGLLSVLVFHRLAGRAISRPDLRLAATLLFATEVWFLRWSASGMESSLAVLMLLLFFDALAAAPRRQSGAFGVGFLAGAAALVRPEYTLLCALLLGLALASPRWRRRWWALAAGIALPLVPWLLFARLELGAAFPSTAAAKSRGWQGWAHLALQTVRLLRVPVSSQVLLLAATAAGTAGALWRRRRRRAGEHVRFYAALAGVWALALPAVFLLRDVQVISRYLLPVTPLLPLAAGAYADRWVRRRPRLRPWVLAAVVLSLVPNAALFATRVLPDARRFPRELETSLGRMADHLHAHGVPGARVACPDIGLMGMRSGLYVVDLGGLIHPDIAALWHERGYREMVESLAFLDRRGADYLVDRHPVPGVLAGPRGDGYLLIPIMAQEVSGLGLRNPEPVTYTLYRIGRSADAEP